MKNIKSYLYYRINIIVICIVFHCIYVSIFMLYQENYELVLYAFVLCMLFGCILMIIDYMNFVKKITEIENLNKRINYDINSLKPNCNDIENGYIDLIKTLFEYNSNMIMNNDKKNDESKMYYLMWTHQIKTPIQALRLLVNDYNEDNVDEIYHQIFSIEQYVEMVINYNKIDSISNDLLIKEYEIDSIIRGVIRKFSKLFIKSKLKLNYETLDYFILTDDKWFTIVLEQIISNAIKYTNNGSISIYLNGDNLIIEDTGIGISEEDLNRVFENGYTGYNGRYDKKSTGIGLFMCKRIMYKLSHKIKIESKINHGTKVIIDISKYNRY